MEIAIGFFHAAPQEAHEKLGPVSTVVLERRAPPPTPRPTPPPPTPKPTLAPVPHVTLAPVPQRAAPKAVKPSGGTQSARHAVPKKTNTHLFARPNASGGTGVAVAPGTGTGAGANDGAGNGNAGGTGNGTGGTGTGTVNADTPCGYVEFRPIDRPRYSNGTASETIRAFVHFPDGHIQSDVFPYPWVYPDGEHTDPWSSTNLRLNLVSVRAQLPPPGMDTSRFPEVIRYLLSKTTPDGTTTLADCPK